MIDKLKEILSSVWEDGYYSPCTYNDVDYNSVDDKKEMRERDIQLALHQIINLVEKTYNGEGR